MTTPSNPRTAINKSSISPLHFLATLFFVLLFSNPASALSSSSTNMNVDAKLKELGLVLPPPTPPKGNYAPCVRTGNLLHLSGHLPLTSDGVLLTGKVSTKQTSDGLFLTQDQGYQAAQACGLQLLATLHHYVDGDWSKIARIVKLVGFVACTDDFDQQPAVINGASDLMVNVFGPEVGLHARSAVGTNALPLNIATEVEAIVELND